MKNLYSFFEIEYDEYFFETIFKTLKNIVNFEYGSIAYNDSKFQYEYGEEPNKRILQEDLKIKDSSIEESHKIITKLKESN